MTDCLAFEPCNTRVFLAGYRFSKIDERASLSGTLVQETMTEFHLGDTLLALEGIDKPRLFFAKFGIFLKLLHGWHPAITIAQKADEEGTATMDLRETRTDNAPFLAIFSREAPTKVDLSKLDT